MADVMEVISWSGEWGLPSIDIECLKVLVCIANSSNCVRQITINTLSHNFVDFCRRMQNSQGVL